MRAMGVMLGHPRLIARSTCLAANSRKIASSRSAACRRAFSVSTPTAVLKQTIQHTAHAERRAYLALGGRILAQTHALHLAGKGLLHAVVLDGNALCPESGRLGLVHLGALPVCLLAGNALLLCKRKLAGMVDIT